MVTKRVWNRPAVVVLGLALLVGVGVAAQVVSPGNGNVIPASTKTVAAPPFQNSGSGGGTPSGLPIIDYVLFGDASAGGRPSVHGTNLNTTSCPASVVLHVPNPTTTNSTLTLPVTFCSATYLVFEQPDEVVKCQSVGSVAYKFNFPEGLFRADVTNGAGTSSVYFTQQNHNQGGNGNNCTGCCPDNSNNGGTCGNQGSPCNGNNSLCCSNSCGTNGFCN